MTPIPLALAMLIGCLAAATPGGEDTGVDRAHQSGPGAKSVRPIGGTGVGVATPELVLSVKYREGEVDGVTLTKFRRERTVWASSFGDQTRSCEDLCSAGLGGSPCGSSCKRWIPDALLEIVKKKKKAHEPPNATREHEEPNEETELLGAPRASVCPTLCANGLGQPLCDCKQINLPENFTPSWASVCAAFCHEDQYVLSGCPQCVGSFAQDGGNEDQVLSKLSTHGRILNTVEGWTLWCTGQCRIGEGGAACNCDRAPFF